MNGAALPSNSASGATSTRFASQDLQPNYGSRDVQEAWTHLASIDLLELCNEAKVERCHATRDLRSCGRLVQYVLSSCKHASLCAECSQRCDVCPICRTPIPKAKDKRQRRLYNECMEAGLFPKRREERSQDIESGEKEPIADLQRLYSFFDVALDNSLVSLICHYVTDVCVDEGAVSSNPVTAFLLDEVVVKDWCNRTFRNIVKGLKGIYNLGVEGMKSRLNLLLKFSVLLAGVSNVLEILESSFKNSLSAQLHDMQHLQECVLKAKQHLEIMMWCIRHQFLENVRSRYSNFASWRSVVRKRKSAAIRCSWPDALDDSVESSGSLFIEDVLGNLELERMSPLEIEAELELTFLQQDGASSILRSKIEGVAGSYPFESNRAAVDVLYLCGSFDMVVAKQAILLYYVFDRRWTMPDGSWRDIVEDFAAAFSITRHSILESFIFYLLDDHTDETLKPLSSLCGTDPILVLEFSRLILENCPTKTIGLFVSGNIPAHLINSYLKKHAPSMEATYLEVMLAVNGNAVSGDLQNEVVQLYLSEVLDWYENLYAQQKWDEKSYSSTRKKLLSALDSMSGYNPEVLLRRLPSDALYEERAILLGKMNQHELALSLYVNKLHVPEQALSYNDWEYESASQKQSEESFENATPLSKVLNESNLYSRVDDVIEENSHTGNNKTPPVQASVSPEILCSSSMLSITTPVCYGAGYVVSGVTDKRKCKPRGILIVGDNVAAMGEVDNFDKLDDTNDEKVEEINSGCVNSLLPSPIKASINWLPSPPCCKEDKDPTYNLDYGSSISLSSPSSLSYSTLSSDVNNYSSASVVSSRVRNDMKGVKQGFDLDGGDSPFSIDSLDSINVIQTPQTDSSSGSHIGLSLFNSTIRKYQYDSEEPILMSGLLEKSSLSTGHQNSIMGHVDSSFQFDCPNTIYSSCDPIQFQKVSDDQAQIRMRVELISQSYEIDELDYCRCLSDEEENINACQFDLFETPSSPPFNTYFGISEFVNDETEGGGKAKEMFNQEQGCDCRIYQHGRRRPDCIW